MRTLYDNDDNSTTPENEVPRDQSVLINMLLWNLLALILLAIYLLVLRTLFPRFVLLRRIPFEPKEDGVDGYRNRANSWWMTVLSKTKKVLIEPLRLLFVISEHELIHHCGLDGYLTIRTLRFCLRVTFVLCVSNLVVLTPTYRYQVQPADCIEYCLNAAQENDSTQDAFKASCVCNWIDMCSMANIPIGSSMLWLPAAFMFLTTLFILQQVEAEYRHVVQVRRIFWRSYGESRLHSVFVECVDPGALSNSATTAGRVPLNGSPAHGQLTESETILGDTSKSRTIADEVQRLFPHEIHRIDLFSARTVQLLRELSDVAHNRVRTVMRLERAIALQEANSGSSVTKWYCINPCRGGRTSTTIHAAPNNREASTEDKHGWRNCTCFGVVQRVDSVEFYSARLDELNTRFRTLKDQLSKQLEQDGTSTATVSPKSKVKPEMYEFAFVTFKAAQTSAIAAQTLLQYDMHARIAPDPNDVRWDSLLKKINRPNAVKWLRSCLSYLLFIVILLFWGTITSFVGAVTSLDALADQIPALHDFLIANPTANLWLQRLIALIYSLIVSLAYPLITWSVTLETHRVSNSQVEGAIMRRYFAFLVIQVFVFYSVAGSVFKTIVEIVSNPPQIVNTLASTIPQNASFFIMFFAAESFRKMIDLVRVYSLLYELLRIIAYGRTVTPREEKYQVCGCCWHYLFPSPMGIAGTNARNLLMLFITVCYSVIQPFVTLAAFFYFVSANISYTLQFIHSTRQLRDGAGKFWRYSYWFIIGSLYSAQLTLVGTLLIKQGYYQAIFIVFGSCIPTLLGSSYIHKRYHDRFMRITLDLAKDIDEQHRASTSDGLESDSEIVDTLCEPIMQYNHVLGDFDQESSNLLDEEAQCQGENRLEGIRVYRYAHPAFYEKDIVLPGSSLIEWQSQSNLGNPGSPSESRSPPALVAPRLVEAATEALQPG